MKCKINYDPITEELLSELNGVDDICTIPSKNLLEILQCQYHDAMELSFDEIVSRIDSLRAIQGDNEEFMEAVYPLGYMFGNMINNYEYVLKNK